MQVNAPHIPTAISLVFSYYQAPPVLWLIKPSLNCNIIYIIQWPERIYQSPYGYCCGFFNWLT